MADDTRVTHPRSGFACALALVCALGCSLPASALAGDIIVRREAGLNAAERADIRADAGVKLERMLRAAEHRGRERAGRPEAAALAALEADPDVRYAVPDVTLHTARSWCGPALLEPVRAGQPAWTPDIDAVRGLGGKTAGRRRHGRDRRPGRRRQPTRISWAQLRAGRRPGLHAARRLHGRRRRRAWPITGPTSPASSAPGATTASRSPASRRESNLLPLRAVDNCGGGQMSWLVQALAYAGQQGVAVAVAAVGTWPGQIDAAQGGRLQPRRSPTSSAPTRTRSSSSPSGNEGNDNDVLPVYPCSTSTRDHDGDIPNLVCVGMTTPTTGRSAAGNVGQRFGRRLRARHVDLVDGARPVSGCSGRRAAPRWRRPIVAGGRGARGVNPIPTRSRRASRRR